MGIRRLHISNKETIPLSEQEQFVIQLILKTLNNCDGNVAKLTSLKEACWKHIKCMPHDKIKYCIALLRIKGLIKYDNTKIRCQRDDKQRGWRLYIKLNKKKFKELYG